MRQNIDLYLRSAFKELEAFAIPNVGTFRKIYRAAEVEEHIPEVKPPMIDLEFTSEVKEEVLLTQYFTENIHMNFLEAENIVQNITFVITDSLKIEGKYHIEQIGTLIRNWDNEIAFHSVPENESFFSHEFFGLKPVSYQKNDYPESESFDNVVEMLDNKYSKKSTSPNKIGWKPLVLLGSFTVLTVLTLVNRPDSMSDSLLANEERLTEEGGKGIVNRDERESISNESLIEIERDVELTQMEDQYVEEESVTKIDDSSDPPLIAQNESPKKYTDSPEKEFDPSTTANRGLSQGDGGTFRGIPEDNSSRIKNDEAYTRGLPSDLADDIKDVTFHVISASFSSYKSASKVLKELKKVHPSAKILSPSDENSTYRISIYSSTNKDEVIQVLNKVKNSGDDDTWVYTENN